MGVKIRESTKMMSVQYVLSHILKLHIVWKVLLLCEVYFSNKHFFSWFISMFLFARSSLLFTRSRQKKEKKVALLMPKVPQF